MFLRVLSISLALLSGSAQAENQTFTNYMSADYGYSVLPILGTGFSVGSTINQESSFEFSYSRGEKDVDYAVMGAELFSLKYKRFWLSSLYTNFGVTHKKVFDETTDKVSPMFTARRKAQTYGLDFSVGQRWEYNNVQFGIDYVGIFQPFAVNEQRAFISKFARRPGLTEGGETHSGRPGARAINRGSANSRRGGMSYDRHNNDWDRLAHHATYTLLKASIGYSF